MRRTSFEGMNCSIARTLEVVGEWWSLLIVRDAMIGIRRFDDFQHRLGISRNILTQRLNRLVDQGVLERVPYQHHPLRHEYRLTEKGRDLWVVLSAMREWGDKWAPLPNGPSAELVHTRCGHTTTIVPTCSVCGEVLELGQLRLVAGPGSDGTVLPVNPRADANTG
ncbi:MAG TPA: helix-turn-helix domain-containing protein [Acidimicrobiales bacterium]